MRHTMAGKKCHTQNSFTIEMSIMFYDIAAQNQLKARARSFPLKITHEGTPQATPQSIFICLTNLDMQQQSQARGSQGNFWGCTGSPSLKQDNILWPVLRCFARNWPETRTSRVGKKRGDWETTDGGNPIQNAIRHSNFIHFSIQF